MTSISWRSLFAAALYAVSAGVDAATWVVEGRVIGVSDGDTLTLLDRDKSQHKIRLSGIDAPERKQPFSDRSKENLSRLAFDRQVEAYRHKKDRYGREVCRVMRGAIDVNLQQIKVGMAWWYREYAKEQTVQDREDYAREEEGAKALRVGLWKDAKPAPPWEWRRQ